MSTVIIVGGSGHNAITRLMLVYHKASASQQNQIDDLLDEFVRNAGILADEVDGNTPVPR
jgi:hypothetical protein